MDLTDVTQGPLTSVARLIDLEEALVSPPTTDLPVYTQWAFRGQPRDFGTLAPSFQRQFTIQSVGTARIIERKLIDAFRQHYVGLKDRSMDMPGPHRIGMGFDLRCLSVMQHYEIPTRLLDWTSDFWTAVYFACASDPTTTAELWAYDRQLFENQRAVRPELQSLMDRSQNPPAEPALLAAGTPQQLLELDPLLTPRMRDQYAHHTVSTNVFADHAPLLFALQQENPPLPGGPQTHLVRYLIDGSCKSRVLQFLADEKKITAGSVFPDVVGLGRFLRWQFDSLRTMMM